MASWSSWKETAVGWREAAAASASGWTKHDWKGAAVEWKGVAAEKAAGWKNYDWASTASEWKQSAAATAHELSQHEWKQTLSHAASRVQLVLSPAAAMEKIVDAIHKDDYESLFETLRWCGVNMRAPVVVFEGHAVRIVGCTPLIVASVLGKGDAVTFLVQHGAEVEMESELGSTPLFCAALCGHLEVVQKLIQLGADYRTANFDGLTPAEVAGQFNHDDVCTFLMEHEAATKEKMFAQEILRTKQGKEMRDLQFAQSEIPPTPEGATDA